MKVRSATGRSGSTGRVFRAAAAVCVLVVGGCVEGHEAVLRPLWGCGLEGEVLTTVRVRARGDLPAAEAESVLLDGGETSLDALPTGVDALTVEGLFGESVVLAVGRTPRLPLDGTQPVYFSPPDQLCPVESSLEPRDRAAMAVAPSGVVLAVGGEGAQGQLMDEIVVLRDDTTEVVIAEAVLPTPLVGHSLTAIGDRAFVMIGGANVEPIPSGDVVRLDVSRDAMSVEVGPSVRAVLDEGPVTPRAFHGAVALPDGRVLVQGGCAHVERGACVPSEASVLRSGFYLEDVRGTFRFDPAPAMLHPRYEHALLASRDGVVFAVGGRDDEDNGLRDIEMLLPGTPGWSPYGPALFEALGERDIVGAALIEGGLVMLVLEDGTMWRVDQNHVESLAGWCGGPDDPCFLPSVDTFPVRRTMLALWGERVLVDRFVVHAGILGRSGAHAVDLSAVKPGGSFQPPGPRVGGSRVALADGTVLGVGGRVPASGSLANPVVTRFRPLLDGPDEGTPDVSAPDSGALVLHDRSGAQSEAEVRISTAAQTQTLLLEPDPERNTDFASTWVHFRGFRSRRFVFEGSYEALNGTPSLHVVFSRGAIARTELAIDADAVRLLAREADGSAVEVRCSEQGLNFAGVGHTVSVVVSPRAIDVRVDGEAFARCPWAGVETVAVGLGAVGAGTMRANGLRLSRN